MNIENILVSLEEWILLINLYEWIMDILNVLVCLLICFFFGVCCCCYKLWKVKLVYDLMKDDMYFFYFEKYFNYNVCYFLFFRLCILV